MIQFDTKRFKSVGGLVIWKCQKGRARRLNQSCNAFPFFLCKWTLTWFSVRDKRQKWNNSGCKWTKNQELCPAPSSSHSWGSPAEPMTQKYGTLLKEFEESALQLFMLLFLKNYFNILFWKKSNMHYMINVHVLITQLHNRNHFICSFHLCLSFGLMLKNFKVYHVILNIL